MKAGVSEVVPLRGSGKGRRQEKGRRTRSPGTPARGLADVVRGGSASWALRERTRRHGFPGKMDQLIQRETAQYSCSPPDFNLSSAGEEQEDGRA